MLNNKGFDLWANEYDKSVNLSEENNEYPFAGYKKVLNYIYNEVMNKDSAKVLDIGFGTGILTTQLYNNNHQITGIDFSRNMINIAKERMPQAKLIRWDFTKGVPDEIKNSKFDYIISTYAIHHLKDEEKTDFIKLLSSNLTSDGKIIIGDVSFETREQLEKCKNKYKNYWDNEEYYFVEEEITKNLKEKYNCEYIKLSHCAGVITILNKKN